jgi:phosphatidylinositol alpha-mannosyltransferase
MKVGIVTNLFYPYPGGVSEHVRQLYGTLTRFGHDVRVVTTSFGRGMSDVEDHVIRLGRSFPVPTNGSLYPVALHPRMGRMVNEMLARERFDVLHIHEPFMPALCLAVLREAAAPVVGTFHANHESPHTYGVFRRVLERHEGRLARRIAVSPAARHTIARHIGGEYEIVPNGVDVGQFSSAERLPELDDGRLSVLFVGRMEPRKGVKFLFQAMPEILDAVPECRLTVVGSGPYARYYRSFIPPAAADRVEFAGFVSAEMLPRYYASSDVYCSPATGGESFGIVLVEAMAAGAAVVASDIAGYRDVVKHEETGLLVEPESPGSIAAGVIRLAREGDLRRRLVENAKRDVEQYSWERVTSRIVEVYEAAVAERRGAGRSSGRSDLQAEERKSGERERVVVI